MARGILRPRARTVFDGRAVADGEELHFSSRGRRWAVSWHPPAHVPPGRLHGANALCVTGDGRVVLISPDGWHWGWPGGRPEEGEDGEQTLRRELLEEACVESAAGAASRLYPVSMPARSPSRTWCWFTAHGGPRSACCSGIRSPAYRTADWCLPPSLAAICGWKTGSSRPTGAPRLRPVLPDRRSEEAPGRSRRVYRTAVWLTFLTRSGRNGRKAYERGRGRVRGPTLRAVGPPAVMVTVATACRASRRGAAKRPGFPGAAAEPETAEHGRREPRRAAAAGRRGKPVTRMPADLRAR